MWVFFVFFREQDESFGERFKQENHHRDETPTEQQRHPSAVRQEETHKGDKCVTFNLQEEVRCLYTLVIHLAFEFTAVTRT